MTKEFNRSAEKYDKVHRRKSIWHRVISILSAVTVFITTYAMILPAITMEPTPGMRVDRVFEYENAQVTMVFQVSGRAVFENTGIKKTGLKDDRIKLEVIPLEDDSTVRAAYIAYAKESIDQEDLHELLTMRLRFTYEGLPLDMRNCQIRVKVAAKTHVIHQIMGDDRIPNPKDTASTLTVPQNSGSEETVMAITAYQGVSNDISLQDTSFLTEDSRELSVDTNLYGNTLAVALYSTTNPSFTVQYYSHFTVFDDSGDISINVIDTSGGKLPVNGTAPKEKPVYLNRVGSTNRFVMATHLELAPLYEQKDFTYVQAPSLVYMDRLRDNGNYELSQVWVLKSGRDPNSTYESDWNIYPDNISFTNRAESANENRIYLAEGAVVRLVYSEHTGSYTNEHVTFFDYDISDGKIYNASNKAYNTSQQTDDVWYARTYLQGINSFTGKAGTVKFGYGNVNTGSGLGDEVWNGNTLNKYNQTGYKGCTFGLVTGFNADGSLKFASGISAPNMFGTAAATGKTEITGKTLEFIRTGDTYVLNAVGGTSTTGLQYFNNPTYVNASGNTVFYNHIFTNNFWPMDSAWTWGADGHDIVFGSAKLINNRRRYQSDINTYSNLPVGDDGLDHNSYFGMKYEIKFTLSEDYMGPLEYMFYGDDDMWVFLDGKLVCDIGGVHSSVGQYVNLWDYLVKGEDHSEHTLTFYYTERGASGSTCYMQFTLPSVDTDTPQLETNTLELNKQVVNSDTDREFAFTIELADTNGNPLVDDYSYIRYDINGNEVEVGILNATEKVVRIRGGEKLIVNYLPKGTQFTITEEAVDGFHTSYSIDGGAGMEGYTATGTLEADVQVTFRNATSALLPTTGSSGMLLYALPLGIAFLFALSLPLIERLRKKRRAA